jgi:uncharacterized protein YegP (UPF0339 family)
MYFELYSDRANEWRWRLRAANHKIVADSGEGYVSKSDARHGISLVMSTTANTTIK